MKIHAVEIKSFIMLCLLSIVGMPLGHSQKKNVDITEQYIYDSNNRLVNKIAPDGRSTKYKYNNNNLLTEVRYPGGRVSYGYNVIGDRVWMKDKSGTTEYYYDAFDRLTGVISRHNPWKLVLYNYDPWNYLTEISILNLDLIKKELDYKTWTKVLGRTSFPNKIWEERENAFNNLVSSLQQERIDKLSLWQEYDIKYTHNIAGNLTSVSTWMGTIKYNYHPELGQIDRQMPNGITSRFRYSADGLLKSVQHENKLKENIAEFTYDYDAAGNVVKAYERTKVGLNITEYLWDNRDFLVGIRLPDGKMIRYEYDLMGNRVNTQEENKIQKYYYDQLGRLVKKDKENYLRNINGNLLSFTRNGKKIKIKSDGRDLPEVIRPSGATVKLKWDGDGHLISKRRKNEITHYLQNPLMIDGFTLAEFNKTGKLTESYIYGDGLIGEYSSEYGTLYFLEDGFSSIRFVTDETGKIIKSDDYSPFGEPILSGGNTIERFRTMGERYLQEINSYVIGGRLYDPETASFLNQHSGQEYGEQTGNEIGSSEIIHEQNDNSQPRCCQTKKTIEIYVAGICTSKESLGNDKKTYNLQGTITTSSLGRTPFISWQETYFDYWRAIFNYIGIPGGKSEVLSQLRNYQDENPESEIIIETHSNGAITIYNLRESIAEDIKAGRINVKEIRIAGAGLRKALQDYFDNVGLGYIKVIEINPENRFSDIIRVLTTPNAELGAELQIVPFSPVLSGIIYKILSVISWMSEPLFPGEIVGTDHHSVEKNYSDLHNKKTNEKTKKGKWTYDNIRSDDDSDNDDNSNNKFPPPPPPPPDYTFAGVFPWDNLSPRNKWFPDPPCPPYCDEKRGGGTGAGFPDEIIDPFGAIERQLGGVELSKTAESNGDLGNLVGAIFDTEKENLILIGDKSTSFPSIRIEDLAIALLSVYGSPQFDLEFTLLPNDPKNPKGDWLKAVYFPEEVVKGTSSGQIMFEADWLLKQYALGVNLNNKGEVNKRITEVPGFKNTAEISLETSDPTSREGTWNRFWLISKEMILKKADSCIFFDVASMGVNVMKQVIDPLSPTGLRDVVTEDDPIGTRFADIFTCLYDKIAIESPEFERLRGLAKAVGLAKWLKKIHIPVDLAWIEKYTHIKMDSAIVKVPALSVKWEKQDRNRFTQNNMEGITTTTHQINLFGGVSLKVNPKYIPMDNKTNAFLESIISQVKSDNINTNFIDNKEGKSFQVTILPITRNSLINISGSKSNDDDGTTYQFNNQNKVVKSLRKDGTISCFTYSQDQKLKTVEISPNNGWHYHGEKNETGSEWIVTNPRNNKFIIKYNRSGIIDKMEINSKTWATYKFSTDPKEVIITYDSFIEKYSYNGDITEHTVQNINKLNTQEKEIQKIKYENNKSDKLIKITGTGMPTYILSYSENGMNPVRLLLPNVEINYEYYKAGQIKAIKRSDGTEINFKYDGPQLVETCIDKQGKQAIYRRFKTGEIQTEDFSGAKAIYKYNKGILTSAMTKQYGEICFSYDVQNHLHEIKLPNGLVVERLYGSLNSKSKRSNWSKLQIIKIIVHKNSEIPE